jgi:hypothetical protein
VNFLLLFGMTEEKARLASKKTGKKVKFKWVDETAKTQSTFLNYIF